MSRPAEAALASGLSRRIAEHVVATEFATLPPATVAATKRSLLDGLGVMLAATTLGEGTGAFAELAIAAGNGPAALIGRGRRAPMVMAALANGALAHAIDFEDGHDGAPVHPNAVQIPAALALAEARGASGRELLTALAIGCDLTCRLGLCLTSDPARLGWYPPPLLGAFGAVAACAKLLRLDARQLADAMSLLLCSTTCSGEIKYSPKSQIRAVRDAFPAQAALQAALLAQSGVSGFDAPLEGKAGLFALYAQGGYDPATLLDGLGERFEGERLTMKAWPSCRGTHAFIEAALSIREEPGFALDRIAEIVMSGHPVMRMLDEPHEAKRAPTTAIDAKFSAPFTTATALIDGAVALASFSEAALSRPELLQLARKTRFRVLEGLSPGAIAHGALRVRLADGRAFERVVAEPLGSPAHPLSPARLNAKFRECAGQAAVPLSAAACDDVIALISSLETLPDLAPLFGLLGPAEVTLSPLS